MDFSQPFWSLALSRGCEAMGFSLSDTQREQLLAYLALLHKWNKAYNLSAIRDPEEMLSKHLLDSLSLVPHLRASSASRIADVGTGAGLPGIPLALCFPDKHFTLCDSAGKKVRFLNQVTYELGLTNVQPVHGRVEQLQPQTAFDIVTSRAFASLGDMLDCCRHLVHAQGEFWAMKGVYPEEELSSLPEHYKVDSFFKLEVPGSLGERCLLVLKARPHRPDHIIQST